ncbi:MAG: hypothetical protein IT281_06950 [Ignavibacteria bacterium]|nr:hypothetical protein [Ignavibacteria bacterium]
MTRKSYFAVTLFVFFSFLGSTYGQLLPSFAIAGGPTAGWHFNPVKDLNLQLKNAGFPEMSESGFLTLGGGGFIDLPMKSNFLRIGMFGSGFTSKQTRAVNDSLTKAANYSMGLGGFSLEYVLPLSKVFDISFGSQFSTGLLKLELYQYGKDLGNYSGTYLQFQNASSSSDISRVYKSRFFTAQPQIGVGIMLRKFMYLKIDCGYQIGIQNTWRVDNDVEVKDFPKGIEAKGLVVKLGLNFGLFIRD